MTQLSVETDWHPSQVARGREAAWRTEAGYHWTEPIGRYSWLAQAAVYLAAFGILLPRATEMMTGARPLDATAIVFALATWGLAHVPGNILNWVRSRFTTHWPTRGMVADLDFGPALARIDGNGVAWSRRLGGESVAWGAVTAILEDREFFILGGGGALLVMLPKTPRVRLALEWAADGQSRTDAIRSVR